MEIQTNSQSQNHFNSISHIDENQTWTNGLWYGYSDYLKKRFGEKVYKLTVSAGFTCPTRDGTKGTEGCAFCDERGSASFYGAERASFEIKKQLLNSMPAVKRRFHANKFMAYFQSFTNTYGPIPYLKEVYDGAVNVENVVGMAVGTRPDCLSNEVLALLNQYAQNRYVSLEIGLQSFDEETLKFYQRGHSVQEGFDAIERAKKYPNLQLSVHLMVGSAPEMKILSEASNVQVAEHAAQNAEQINRLGIHGVKIHQLMILKDTVLAKRFAIEPWPMFDMDRYHFYIMKFLEHLDPNIHIERTHALSSHPDELVAPKWSANRFAMHNGLQKMMKSNYSKQGKYFSNLN